MKKEVKTKRIGYLEFIRRSKKLKQKDFAEKIGVKQGTLSKMETFKLPVSAGVLKGLRDEYNLDVNQCLDGNLFELKSWVFQKENKKKGTKEVLEEVLVEEELLPEEEVVPSDFEAEISRHIPSVERTANGQV